MHPKFEPLRILFLQLPSSQNKQRNQNNGALLRGLLFVYIVSLVIFASVPTEGRNLDIKTIHTTFSKYSKRPQKSTTEKLRFWTFDVFYMVGMCTQTMVDF